MSESLPPLRAPEPLDARHALDGFVCGAPTLETWLKRRARANQASGASRTYVLCRGDAVVGFYALAAGAVEQATAPGRIRRDMPDPIPVIVLGRLAVAVSEQGGGLGRALVRDALLRVRAAAREVGIAAVLVHALNARAAAFYVSCGFVPAAGDPLLLMARLRDIEAALSPG